MTASSPRFKLRPISQTALIVITGLFIILTANMTLIGETYRVYSDQAHGIWFTLAVIIALYSVLLLLLTLLSSRYTLRVVLSLILAVAALSAYFTDTFGTVIDNVMIQNLFETDQAETRDLLSAGLFIRLFLLAVIPIAFIWRVPIRRVSLGKSLLQKGGLCLAALVMLFGVVELNSNRFASYVRDHKVLRLYATPIYPIYSFFYFVDERLFPDQASSFIRILPDAKQTRATARPRLSVLVIGETARADRFQLNGYARPTNPRLSAMEHITSFEDVMACGTSTSVSVPCMFSEMTRETYDSHAASNQENVLDVLDRIGVSVLWRDNNSGAKHVADRVAFEDFTDPAVNPDCDSECRDTGMLSGLQDYIDDQTGDILVVMHQMGNHGPAYYKRYPKAFEIFAPTCQTAELSACSDEEISNAYDNAITYTDYFLAEVIALLKDNDARFATSMLYVSDHGESLGENGIYLHGMPYALSPIAQRHVPVILWHGSESGLDIDTLASRLRTPLSHDALFNTLLELYQVDSKSGAVSDDLFLLVDR